MLSSADAYVSVLDGELHVVSSLQSLQVALELAVVEENLLHHVGPLDEPESLLKEDTRSSDAIQSNAGSLNIQSKQSYN